MAHFSLKIETDNIAFGEHPSLEVARILRDVADRIEQYKNIPTGIEPVFDNNGNTVGSYRHNTR